MNNEVLNMVIPAKLHNELKQEAKNKNISLASLVRLICTEYLQKNNM